MDNQQATLMAASFYMGEGHFILNYRDNGRGGKQYHTEIGFTNQDPALLDFICSWLQDNRIPHFISGCTNAFQIKVQRFGAIRKMVDILEPLMFGNKLHEARILRRFVETRQKHSGGNEARKYTEVDASICEEMRSFRESSETTRAPECWQNHRHIAEDIVHA